MKLEVTVSLPREAETVRLVRAVVADALGKIGVSQECVEEIQLALSEACNNVVDHATVDDEYEVRIELVDEECSIVVRNSGTGFDAAGLAGVMPDVSSPRGRGVAIMRALMDEIEFRSEPDGGDVVRLVKNLTVHPDAPLVRLRRSPEGRD